MRARYRRQRSWLEKPIGFYANGSQQGDNRGHESPLPMETTSLLRRIRYRSDRNSGGDQRKCLFLRIFSSDLADKAVATLRQSLDVARSIGFVAERLAQFLDRCV